MHIDNLRLSHMQQKELNKIIDQLSDVFGSEGEILAVSYGKLHKYLGITIDWSITGKFMFNVCIKCEIVVVAIVFTLDVTLVFF